MDSSKFAMWRAAVAVILVDGEIDRKKQSWFEKKVEHLELTPEQRQVLIDDLGSGVDFDSVIELITKPSDRVFLLHLIRSLGHIDNDYSSKEKEMFESYKAEIMKGIDLSVAESDVQRLKIIDEEQTRRTRKEKSFRQGF